MNFCDLSDEELVKLVHNNDNGAIEELFNRYKYIATSVAHSYFLTGGDTEDLVQEGMVAIFKAVWSFNGKSSFKSYLYTCVKNRILTVIKSSNRYKNQPLNNYLSLSTFFDGDLDKSEIIIDTEFGPEEKYINEETVREFSLKISKVLSDYEYKILVLYLKGYTQKEISAHLVKKEKSIDNALQRIKKKIQSIEKG